VARASAAAKNVRIFHADQGVPIMRRQVLKLHALAAALLCSTAAFSQSAAGLDHGSARVERGAPGRPLSAASNAAPEAIVANRLRARGYSSAALASLDAAQSRRGTGGATHVRLEQKVAGLTVYGAYVKGTVNARGELIHLIDNLARVSAPRAAQIDASGAMRVALTRLHPGRSADLGVAGMRGNTTLFNGGTFFYGQPEATAVAIPMGDGSLARGWLVQTWTRRDNLLHHTLVGGDGRVLDVELRTASDSYNVFPIDPSKGAQQVVPGPGGGNVQSPIGWLAGTQTTLTIGGNNAAAYLDRDDNNASDGGGASAGSDFLAAANLAVAPTDASNQNVSVQNLFYLTNVIHDILYRHGFNEAAGNFQGNNFGKGGRGGDPVQAEAQDGGGTDNANFATPGDGRAPRMQMYLWTGAGATHKVQVSGGATFDAKGADFGTELTTTGVTAALTPTTPADGCTAISTGLAGRIALIDRGACEFATKVLNAQRAGAIGAVIANNDAANPNDYFTMGSGADGGSVTIGSAMVSKSSGDALKALGTPTVNLAKLALQPLQIDASLDSDVVYHEVCHGLTWRMIGRMSGPLAGAIGEGMSDSCSLLINSENDVVGEYSASSPRGIRSAPYTNYPRTYADVEGTGVHLDGEVYAAIVWKMIQDFGPGSRDKLFGYLVGGMNFTPAKPTFEDMRDGILTAVSVGSSPADCSVVWAAFAHYGVGVGAQGTVRGAKVLITESKAVPPSCI
jgi:extracellular elastinolytic metalloproteinase